MKKQQKQTLLILFIIAALLWIGTISSCIYLYKKVDTMQRVNELQELINFHAQEVI